MINTSLSVNLIVLNCFLAVWVESPNLGCINWTLDDREFTWVRVWANDDSEVLLLSFQVILLLADSTSHGLMLEEHLVVAHLVGLEARWVVGHGLELLALLGVLLIFEERVVRGEDRLQGHLTMWHLHCVLLVASGTLCLDVRWTNATTVVLTAEGAFVCIWDIGASVVFLEWLLHLEHHLALREPASKLLLGRLLSLSSTFISARWHCLLVDTRSLDNSRGWWETQLEIDALSWLQGFLLTDSLPLWRKWKLPLSLRHIARWVLILLRLVWGWPDGLVLSCELRNVVFAVQIEALIILVLGHLSRLDPALLVNQLCILIKQLVLWRNDLAFLVDLNSYFDILWLAL